MLWMVVGDSLSEDNPEVCPVEAGALLGDKCITELVT